MKQNKKAKITLKVDPMNSPNFNDYSAPFSQLSQHHPEEGLLSVDKVAIASSGGSSIRVNDADSGRGKTPSTEEQQCLNRNKAGSTSRIQENDDSKATMQTVGAILHTESETIFSHQHPPQYIDI